ncbi:MAG: flavin reductase family protein [Phycisphaerae bacterium]
MSPEIKDRIGVALGRIASGVFVVTARHGGRETGMLASWVQQAGFDPPAVSVAIKRGRPILGLIEASGAFYVNVLPAEPIALFRHFGRGFSLEENAFAGLATSAAPGGAALADRIAGLSCRLSGRVSAGDHEVLIGEVIDGDGNGSASPHVHLRRQGWSY